MKSTDPDAVLGPVDPQLGMGQGGYPAASILKALEQPNPNRDDQTLIVGDMARKAINQVYFTVRLLLLEHLSQDKAEEVAKMLSEGRWTHDYPIAFDQAKEIGLPERSNARRSYELMDLYPQSQQRRPGVDFVPMPYPPATPGPRKSERDH